MISCGRTVVLMSIIVRFTLSTQYGGIYPYQLLASNVMFGPRYL